MLVEPIRIELSLGIMFQTVNCYLIPGEQLTLIDCGLDSESNWLSFQKKLNNLGYKVKDIEQVIITHEHRDHIGLLPEVMENSDCLVRVPKSIEGWFSEPDVLKERQGKFNEKIFRTLGFPEEIYDQITQFYQTANLGRKIEELDRFQFFEEGDFLSLGNTEWEVMNTPGHSPTQYVFFEKEQKRIFGSDMLLPIAPMPIPTENHKNKEQPIQPLNDLIDSFGRLKDFNFETVYPGHGPVFSDANKMIDKQLGRIQMRKEECLEIIKNGYHTPYQINRRMYPYQQIPPDFSGMFMILGYTDLLQAEGRIKGEIDGDGFLKFECQ